MNIQFFINNSEKNMLRKSLSSGPAFTGAMREETSIINPVFVIEADNLTGYNYLYVDEFKRYYFIDDISVVRNRLWRVSCTVDVLRSFQADILKLSVIISKQQSQFMSNLFLNDGSFVADSRVGLEVLNFPKGFLPNPQLILTTIGPGRGRD